MWTPQLVFWMIKSTKQKVNLNITLSTGYIRTNQDFIFNTCIFNADQTFQVLIFFFFLCFLSPECLLCAKWDPNPFTGGDSFDPTKQILQFHEVGTIISPILQMRKLRHREVKLLTVKWHVNSRPWNGIKQPGSRTCPLKHWADFG